MYNVCTNLERTDAADSTGRARARIEEMRILKEFKRINSVDAGVRLEAGSGQSTVDFDGAFERADPLLL